MGCSQSHEIIDEEGVCYADIRNTLESFDLVFFKGGDFYSDIIRFAQGSRKSRFKNLKSNSFSHVGIVIKPEVLPELGLDKNKIYIWESTLTHSVLGDGIPNIKGKFHLGVQLRDLDKVIPAYNSSPKSRIAFAPLDKHARSTLNSENFQSLFQRLDGIVYDSNITSLTGAQYKCCRPARKLTESIFNTNNWLFCSELVATVYKNIGLFPSTLNVSNVIPTDFLGTDTDYEVPVVIEEPIYIKKAE